MRVRVKARLKVRVKMTMRIGTIYPSFIFDQYHRIHRKKRILIVVPWEIKILISPNIYLELFIIPNFRDLTGK